MAAKTDRRDAGWVLVLIGVAKLLKAAALVFFALELHHLLDANMAERLGSAFHHVRIDPGNDRVHELITKATGVSPATLHKIRLGSYLYAALFATEGIGLVLRKRWAEYFTTVTTSLLLPLEAYEIFHGHHHVAKVIVMCVNVVIVIYLIQRLMKARKAELA